MPDQDTLARLAAVTCSASSLVHNHGAEDPLLPSRSVSAAPSPTVSSTSATSLYATAVPYMPSPPLPATPMHGQPMPAHAFCSSVQQLVFSPAHCISSVSAATTAPVLHLQEEQEFSLSMPQVQGQQVTVQ